VLRKRRQLRYVEGLGLAFHGQGTRLRALGRFVRCPCAAESTTTSVACWWAGQLAL